MTLKDCMDKTASAFPNHSLFSTSGLHYASCVLRFFEVYFGSIDPYFRNYLVTSRVISPHAFILPQMAKLELEKVLNVLEQLKLVT